MEAAIHEEPPHASSADYDSSPPQYPGPNGRLFRSQAAAAVASAETAVFCMLRGSKIYVPLRNIDTGIIRAGRFIPRANARFVVSGSNEQGQRASIRQVALDMGCQIDPASKDELELLKNAGLIGRRAPCAGLVEYTQATEIVRGFGFDIIAATLKSCEASVRQNILDESCLATLAHLDPAAVIHSSEGKDHEVKPSTAVSGLTQLRTHGAGASRADDGDRENIPSNVQVPGGGMAIPGTKGATTSPSVSTPISQPLQPVQAPVSGAGGKRSSRRHQQRGKREGGEENVSGNVDVENRDANIGGTDGNITKLPSKEIQDIPVKEAKGRELTSQPLSQSQSQSQHDQVGEHPGKQGETPAPQEVQGPVIAFCFVRPSNYHEVREAADILMPEDSKSLKSQPQWRIQAYEAGLREALGHAAWPAPTSKSGSQSSGGEVAEKSGKTEKDHEGPVILGKRTPKPKIRLSLEVPPIPKDLKKKKGGKRRKDDDEESTDADQTTSVDNGNGDGTGERKKSRTEVSPSADDEASEQEGATNSDGPGYGSVFGLTPIPSKRPRSRSGKGLQSGVPPKRRRTEEEQHTAAVHPTTGMKEPTSGYFTGGGFTTASPLIVSIKEEQGPGAPLPLDPTRMYQSQQQQQPQQQLNSSQFGPYAITNRQEGMISPIFLPAQPRRSGGQHGQQGTSRSGGGGGGGRQSPLLPLGTTLSGRTTGTGGASAGGIGGGSIAGAPNPFGMASSPTFTDFRFSTSQMSGPFGPMSSSGKQTKSTTTSAPLLGLPYLQGPFPGLPQWDTAAHPSVGSGEAHHGMGGHLALGRIGSDITPAMGGSAMPQPASTSASASTMSSTSTSSTVTPTGMPSVSLSGWERRGTGTSTGRSGGTPPTFHRAVDTNGHASRQPTTTQAHSTGQTGSATMTTAHNPPGHVHTNAPSALGTTGQYTPLPLETQTGLSLSQRLNILPHHSGASPPPPISTSSPLLQAVKAETHAAEHSRTPMTPALPGTDPARFDPSRMSFGGMLPASPIVAAASSPALLPPTGSPPPGMFPPSASPPDLSRTTFPSTSPTMPVPRELNHQRRDPSQDLSETSLSGADADQTTGYPWLGESK